MYTCDQLQGLYVAHVDDRVAYNDLPKSIAALIKLNFGLECIVSHKTFIPSFKGAFAVNHPIEELP